MLADESRFSRPHPLQVAGSSQALVTVSIHKLCLLLSVLFGKVWQKADLHLKGSLRGAAH